MFEKEVRYFQLLSEWYFNVNIVHSSISERFWQLYFLTKSSTLLVKTSRETKFLHSFSERTKCKLVTFFCLCLLFRLKVKKRYLFWKKKVGIFRFRVNDILISILSPLHPFLTLPNDDLLSSKEVPVSFCRLQTISLKAQKGTFFQLEVMLLKVRKRYLFKNIK